MTLPIKTGRLLLRRFMEQDVADMLDYLAHASVARATPEIEATEAGLRRYIEMQNSYAPFEQDKCFDLAIERLIDGKVMGMLTLIRRKHSQAEIGYALGIDYRRRGYATEAAEGLMEYAFSSLGLHRIQATTSADNPDSYKVMERLGMRREGHLREATIRDGEWVDQLIYGILEQEWRARYRGVEGSDD
jgi:RimJ/RimL family protein N-acetyltransferase